MVLGENTMPQEASVGATLWCDMSEEWSEPQLFEMIKPYVEVLSRPAKQSASTIPGDAKALTYRFPSKVGTLKTILGSDGSCKVIRHRKSESVEREDGDCMPLVESGNWDQLWRQFECEGYAILRGLVPEEEVEAAVANLEEELGRSGNCGYTIESRNGNAIRGSDKYVSETVPCRPAVFSKVVRHARVRRLLSALSCGRSSCEQRLFDSILCDPKFTWIRAKAPGEQTVEHFDKYHFEKDAPEWFKDKEVCFGTLWVALEACAPDAKGGLVLLRRSHKFRQSESATQLLPSSYNSASSSWRVPDFKAGDAVIFDIRTIHATPQNASADFRFSLDTRFAVVPTSGFSKRPWCAQLKSDLHQDLCFAPGSPLRSPAPSSHDVKGTNGAALQRKTHGNDEDDIGIAL